MKTITKWSGYKEDICECGVSHPNTEWLRENDPYCTKYHFVHNCCDKKCCEVWKEFRNEISELNKEEQDDCTP